MLTVIPAAESRVKAQAQRCVHELACPRREVQHASLPNPSTSLCNDLVSLSTSICHLNNIYRSEKTEKQNCSPLRSFKVAGWVEGCWVRVAMGVVNRLLLITDPGLSMVAVLLPIPRSVYTHTHTHTNTPVLTPPVSHHHQHVSVISFLSLLLLLSAAFV